jgi:hypothetical protein
VSFGTVRNRGVGRAVLRRSEAEALALRRQVGCCSMESWRTRVVAPSFKTVPTHTHSSRGMEPQESRSVTDRTQAMCRPTDKRHKD